MFIRTLTPVQCTAADTDQYHTGDKLCNTCPRSLSTFPTCCLGSIPDRLFSISFYHSKHSSHTPTSSCVMKYNWPWNTSILPSAERCYVPRFPTKFTSMQMKSPANKSLGKFYLGLWNHNKKKDWDVTLKRQLENDKGLGSRFNAK